MSDEFTDESVELKLTIKYMCVQYYIKLYSSKSMKLYSRFNNLR